MNAVIYARYSSSAQNEQSIDGQIRVCREYAERNGMTVLHEYIDKAVSGRTDNRPAFQRMIADAKSGQFQYIIVYMLDRFSRDRYDSVYYKRELERYGVHVVSATEQLGSGDEGVILEAILESMAEMFSRKLAVRVKNGMQQSAINGTYVGGPVPFGYKVVDKKLVVDSPSAHVVKQIFEWYAAGIGKMEILRRLKEQGYNTNTGRPFSINSLTTLLKNKKYVGIYLYDGQEVTGGCPRIIDDVLFAKAQKILSASKRSSASKKAKVEYLLQGRAFCGYCGAPMVGESGRGKSGTIYNYYACAKKKRHHSCNKKNEKKGYIEWYVVEQTVQYVLDPMRIELIAHAVVERFNQSKDVTLLTSLKKQISSLEAQINKSVDQLIESDSKPVKKRLEEKIETLSFRKEHLEEEYTNLSIRVGVSLTEEQICAWLKSFCHGDPLDVDFQRKILRTFVNAVYFFDDKFVMFWNLRDSKQVSFVEMLDSMDEVLTAEPLQDSNSVRINKGVVHHKRPETIWFRVFCYLFSSVMGQIRPPWYTARRCPHPRAPHARRCPPHTGGIGRPIPRHTALVP